MATRKQPSRTSRKPKKPRRQRPAQVYRDNTHDDFTVTEWCRRRRVSRGLFYKMLRDGTAPKTMKHNKSRRISRSADAEWERAREAATAAKEAA
jgi:hypothetical protein